MRMTASKIVLAIQFLVFTVVGGPLALAKDVEISTISPLNGRVSDTISISGSGFAPSSGANKVVFTRVGGGFVTATVVKASANVLTTVVPSGAASGRVYVQVGNVKSNAVRFEVNSDVSTPTPGPVVSLSANPTAVTKLSLIHI